jgi:hypothetical protein
MVIWGKMKLKIKLLYSNLHSTMATPRKSFLQAAKIPEATVNFYTWRFFVGFDPHSFTVVAETAEKAKQKIALLVDQGKFNHFEGPFTRRAPFPSINFSADGKHYEKATMKDLVRLAEPVVSSTDTILSVAALDG